MSFTNILLHSLSISSPWKNEAIKADLLCLITVFFFEGFKQPAKFLDIPAKF
jgi:hypothetical protein